MDLQLNEITVERELGGRTLTLSTGLMARQAAGAVVVRYADTMVLTAATCSPPRSKDLDFFPLMVDYREKTYAAGKFPGGFFKREKAPSAKEILTMRLADRPIRPLFPNGYRQDVIIQSIVLSADMENEPDVLSLIGASAAVSLSTMPFAGPIGAVRMGLVDGELVINPTHKQADEGDLNLVIAGTTENITMVEASANELPEDRMLEALNKGHEVCRTVAEMIRELEEKAGRTERETPADPEKPACLEQVREAAGDRLGEALRAPTKQARREAVQALGEELVDRLAGEPDEGGLDAEQVIQAFGMLEKAAVREMAKAGKRVDGRDTKTVRPIDCRVGVLPRTHGSSLFTRGETQALVAATLGTVSDTQRVDGLRDAYEEKWFLHYQAPGFSVGESRPPRGPSRRDVGHGMLGQRALKAVIPANGGFPYTVRAVSEVLEMNGSSSMATVCGATLALMDAGVPIRAPVAGIAMGLIQDPGEDAVVLTDILGDEDHCGDMDFKVCGTSEGITALQMDIKVAGISAETLQRALAQAREGRLHILETMSACLASPRPELSPRAPRIHALPVDSDRVGKVIGPGGKTVRAVQDETGAQIDIDDSETPNMVTICAPDEESLQKAVSRIEALIAVPEVGQTYEGPVRSIRDFGVFVEILPGTDGMCHISELAEGYVKQPDDVCQVGDTMKVKVVNIDDMGRVRLSRKAVLIEERGGEPADESAGGEDKQGEDKGGEGRRRDSSRRRGRGGHRRDGGSSRSGGGSSRR